MMVSKDTYGSGSMSLASKKKLELAAAVAKAKREGKALPFAKHKHNNNTSQRSSNHIGSLSKTNNTNTSLTKQQHTSSSSASTGLKQQQQTSIAPSSGNGTKTTTSTGYPLQSRSGTFTNEFQPQHTSLSGASSSSSSSSSVFSSERSKYLEEYSRIARPPSRASSARGAGCSTTYDRQGSTQTFQEKVQQAKAEFGFNKESNKTTNSHHQGGGDGGFDDDMFDCVPLSAWSDDTLIGLPTSYVLYDKFQKLSTAPFEYQQQQRAMSAKTSKSLTRGMHTGAQRLVSSSKGPRRTSMLGGGRSTPTKATTRWSGNSRPVSRDGMLAQHYQHQNNYHNGLEASEHDMEEEENVSSSASISEWPNSLRIVVPVKLKKKDTQNSNPNLHNSSSYRGNNYYGYHSRPSSRDGGSHSSLRVQKQREERERERERSAALAKAKLLSNYRNRHNKIQDNDAPMVVSKKVPLDTHKQRKWQ